MRCAMSDGEPNPPITIRIRRIRIRLPRWMSNPICVWAFRLFNAGIVVWGLASSRTVLALLGGLLELGFEHGLNNHFNDAWFQKSMRIVIRAMFGLLALCAVIAFGGL